MNPQKGGVQKVSDTLAKYFIAAGHQVSYLIYEKAETDLYDYPAKIYYLPNSDFFSSENILFYHDLLAKLSIDIIINHDASNERSILFLNTGKHTAKKISLYHNDPLLRLNTTNVSKGKSKYIPKFLLQIYRLYKTKKDINYLLQNSDSLILLSDSFANTIKNQTGIVSNKISAINNPVLILDNEVKILKKKQVLFVGRIELKQKRPDVMLHIWSNIHQLYPDWELLFLGDGPDRSYIENLSAKLNLKNVTFKGYVNPEIYYREASIVCMTSDYEGFPMVLLESMQYGVVPIAFNNWASLKDSIIDDKTGFTIPSGDIKDYIEKLSMLMENEGIRNQNLRIPKFM